MTENNEPTNAGPDPIQLPAQDPVPAPIVDSSAPEAPKRSNRKLLAGIAGAAALIAVAGVSGYAIGNAADHNERGDGPGVSRFEANGAPEGSDRMRGGPEGMKNGDGDSHAGMPDGDRRGRGHHDRGGMARPGQGMPDQEMPGQEMPGQEMPGQGMPGQGFDGPAGPTPSAPVTPSS